MPFKRVKRGVRFNQPLTQNPPDMNSEQTFNMIRRHNHINPLKNVQPLMQMVTQTDTKLGQTVNMQDSLSGLCHCHEVNDLSVSVPTVDTDDDLSCEKENASTIKVSKLGEVTTQLPSLSAVISRMTSPDNFS